MYSNNGVGGKSIVAWRYHSCYIIILSSNVYNKFLLLDCKFEHLIGLIVVETCDLKSRTLCHCIKFPDRKTREHCLV